jgi:methionine-rich copper-binding protein CopC
MNLRVVLVGLLAASLAAPAFAHALLERAEPKVGSLHNPPPREIRLKFSEAVEPSMSHVTLKSGDGETVPLESVSVLPSNHRVLVAKPASALAPGTYHVIWRVVSVDTHRTEGDFYFGVGR